MYRHRPVSASTSCHLRGPDSRLLDALNYDGGLIKMFITTTISLRGHKVVLTITRAIALRARKNLFIGGFNILHVRTTVETLKKRRHVGIVFVCH